MAVSVPLLYGPVQAEGNRLPLIPASGTFVEEMPDNPRTAGQRVVGVHLGVASGPFDPARFRVALGEGVAGGPVCIKITTRDGRYWSLNSFATRGVTAPEPGIEFRTALGGRLKNYDLSDFAVRVVSHEKCVDDIQGEILPAILSAGALDTLVLLVNAGNPLAVGARYNEAGAGDVPCRRPASGASSGYNFVCELPLPKRHGPRRVTIGIKDKNGISLSETITVRMP